jgi:hypothetical protein
MGRGVKGRRSRPETLDTRSAPAGYKRSRKHVASASTAGCGGPPSRFLGRCCGQLAFHLVFWGMTATVVPGLRTIEKA